MGGKKYFCDYCQVRIQNNPQIIKKHNQGLLHQKCKISHFEQYKSLEEILVRERGKIQCKRAATNSCTFGAFFRFSHYSTEELAIMEQRCRTMAQTESQLKRYQKPLQDFLDECHRNKISLGFKNKIYLDLPEHYLPPSLRVWDLTQVLEEPTNDWG